MGSVYGLRGASASELAADLERAVETGASAAQVKMSLELLRRALQERLGGAAPRERRLIAGLLAELDEIEPQLDTGRIRWLGGIERQCRILARCDLE